VNETSPAVYVADLDDPLSEATTLVLGVFTSQEGAKGACQTNYQLEGGEGELAWADQACTLTAYTPDDTIYTVAQFPVQ
jgi:hypothetical protein